MLGIGIVFAIVIVFNVLSEIRQIRESVPQIGASELALHRFLCSWLPRPPVSKWVRVVEIDDEAHARYGEPTDRRMLARLISNATRGEAAVIVLDVKLLSPNGFTAGQDRPERATANMLLLQAVQKAAALGVPMILGTWLDEHEENFTRMPNIFRDDALVLADLHGRCTLESLIVQNANGSMRLAPSPACTRIGNINLPIDKRRLPLVTSISDPPGTSESLALAAVSAFEDVYYDKLRTVSEKHIASAIAKRSFPFATFIPENGFDKIPIDRLNEGIESAIRACRGHIVLIGGTWHSDSGRGTAVDAYDTPIGSMRGLYLHANYIEALLDRRYAEQVPLWAALVFDAAIGVVLYLSFHRLKRHWAKILLVILPAILLLSTYVVFANLNLYLEFILPLLAYFFHLLFEIARDYIRRISKSSAG